MSLLAYNLTFNDVAVAVSTSNILVTGGNIKTSDEDYLIRARNKKYQGLELLNIPVKSDNSGNIIRLSDVATVKDTWSETPDRIYFNGEAALNISISGFVPVNYLSELNSETKAQLIAANK